MNACGVISICFGLVALWVWVYEPPMLVEHEDGTETLEDSNVGRLSCVERLRVIFELALLYLVVLAIFYHEIAWKLLQEYMQFQF